MFQKIMWQGKFRKFSGGLPPFCEVGTADCVAALGSSPDAPWEIFFTNN